MKDEFKGYYAPTEAEFQQLWREGLVVLDTNVLLDLYRLPATARDELLALLEILKDRLWVPHQVALEFQRRRLSVISDERKNTEDALTKANALFEEVQKRVSSLQIDKRGVGVEGEPLIADLKGVNDRLAAAIDTVHKSQLDITANDPVRNRLDLLLHSKIGLAPANQADLDRLTENGDQRYERKIPPGFADADKEKNPNEASFYYDGLVYERKFGDLIIWRQLLRYVKEQATKAVLLITADRKEDWWWKEKGRTIGPRPELAREIAQLGEVSLFWMYSPAQFLENAKQFTAAEVSESSVIELKDVSRIASKHVDAVTYEPRSRRAKNLDGAINRRLDQKTYNQAVLSWLREDNEDVSVNRGFPDFVVHSGFGPHGFEVRYLPNLFGMLMSSAIVEAMLRGWTELNEGHLTGITIVIVVDQEEISSMHRANRLDLLDQRLAKLLRKYPVSELLVGYVDEGGEFNLAASQVGHKASEVRSK